MRAEEIDEEVVNESERNGKFKEMRARWGRGRLMTRVRWGRTWLITSDFVREEGGK